MNQRPLPPEEARYYRMVGSYLGYPDCCIEQFIEDGCASTAASWESGKWTGSGYVPCPGCAPKVEKDFENFISEHISPNRLAAEKFPARIRGLETRLSWRAYQSFFQAATNSASDRQPSTIRQDFLAS